MSSGADFMKPCALLKLDFLTSAALVRRKGFIKPVPALNISGS